LIGVMRSIRRLSPRQDQNFALNEISILSEGLEGFFGQISLIGLFIGLFSILVGGFGIANIMFVSVKERINIIGIQKSLGAKNRFVLFQFLIESVLLTTFGGVVGLFLVYLVTVAVGAFSDFELFMTVENIIKGIAISGIVGLLSGIVPAFFASRLDPVVAIRAKG